MKAPTSVRVYKKSLRNRVFDVFVDLVYEARETVSPTDIQIRGLVEAKRQILREAFPPEHPIWKESIFPDAAEVTEEMRNRVIAAGSGPQFTQDRQKLTKLIEALSANDKTVHKLYRFDSFADRLSLVREEKTVQEFLDGLEKRPDAYEFLGEDKSKKTSEEILQFTRSCIKDSKGIYVVAYCKNCGLYEVLVLKNERAVCPKCKEVFVKGADHFDFMGANYTIATKEAARLNQEHASKKADQEEGTFYFQGTNYGAKNYQALFDALYINLSSGKDVVFEVDEYGQLVFSPRFLSFIEQIQESGFSFPSYEVEANIGAYGYGPSEAMYDLFHERQLLSPAVRKNYGARLRVEYRGKAITFASVNDYLDKLKAAVIEDDEEKVAFFLSLVKEPYLEGFFQNHIDPSAKETSLALLFYHRKKEFIYIQTTMDGTRSLYAPDFDSFIGLSNNPDNLTPVLNYYQEVIAPNPDIFEGIPSYDIGVADPHYFLAILRCACSPSQRFLYEDFATSPQDASYDFERLYTLRYTLAAQKKEETVELKSFLHFLDQAKRADGDPNDPYSYSVNPDWVAKGLSAYTPGKGDPDGFDAYVKIHPQWRVSQIPIYYEGKEASFKSHLLEAIKNKNPFPYVGFATPMLKRAFLAKGIRFDEEAKTAADDYDKMVQKVKEIEAGLKKLGI